MAAERGIILSYQALRVSLGAIGLALPPVVCLGYLAFLGRVPPSLSDTYYSPMGGVFIGALWAVGVFLISYRGYAPLPGERLRDRPLSLLAGLGAFGVALFPVAQDDAVARGSDAAGRFALPDTFTQALIGADWAGHLHYLAAASFFGALAVFTYFQFTLTGAAAPRPRKMRRNRWYRNCGRVLIGAVLAMAALKLPAMLGAAPLGLAEPLHLFLIAEAVATWAFALSWLIKGDALPWLRDEPEPGEAEDG